MTIDEIIHECEHLSDEFDYENMNGNMAYSTYSDFKDSISKIQKWLEENRWIPVSERLPDVKQAILATNGISRYTTTYLPEWDNSFTHWMPLPEPPETTREEAGHWDGIAPLQEV